jgi:hypothetical protein
MKVGWKGETEPGGDAPTLGSKLYKYDTMTDGLVWLPDRLA